ncbi:MAG: hypothetical protein ABI693_32335 [Bryobacteraceae bacterium]
MNAPLVDKSPWTINAGSLVPALEIVLAKQTLVLAWNQFVYAEGSDDEVWIAFASHDVIVRGAGLSPLLQAIPGHQLASIREPARAERFSGMTARFISGIEVRRVDAD